MKSNFYALLARMKHIDRWGLMRNTRRESLSEHCLDTAFMAQALVIIHNRRFGGDLDPEHAAVLAMFHDASEIITGDMPTPVKYFNPEIRQAYKKVEVMAERKLVDMLPEELQDVYAPVITGPGGEVEELVKAADKLSAYIKCVEELKAGNNEFREAAAQTKKALEAYELPEVRYFLDTFMDSFSLTLDELK